MNVVFISPHFPLYFHNFCSRLKERGVNVLGIGDEDYNLISDETKNAVTEYYKVSNLENFEENEELYGIAKDKNVIIVQLESVQNFVINRKVNGKEVTPNLNKFLKENIEIQNLIVQSYSTTADSEYSTLTSLYPLDNGQMYSMYYGNINNDFFKLYKKENYKTYYKHSFLISCSKFAP